MRKSLLVCSLLSVVLLAGCSLTNHVKCPSGSEYWETKYENGNLDSQGCFKLDSDVMEGHWIYYFENGGKDMEGDMVDDLAQGEWVFYDEGGNNIVIMRGNYKDDVEDGEWKYYDDEGNYICTDIYSEGELTDEGNCEYEEPYEEDLAEEELDEEELNEENEQNLND